MYNYIYKYISCGLLIGLELPATRSMAGLIRCFDGVATCQNCILGSPPRPTCQQIVKAIFWKANTKPVTISKYSNLFHPWMPT